MAEREESPWIKKVESAYKRLDDEWRKDARAALRIYHASNSPKSLGRIREPFNILYSNTETLAPALFNSSPRPDISLRRAKSDPVAKLGSKALGQYLDYQIDCNDARYESISEAVSQAVLSALVPGLGQVRLREPSNPDEHLSFESVPFDRFIWGWARRWQDVPWIAFGHDLTYQDFKERYPKFAKDISEEDDEVISSSREGENEDSLKRLPGVLVWEIWDKASQTVFEICDHVRESELESRPWPLKFSGSFPCPRPLVFVDRIATLVPVTLYTYYQEQADELNRLTRRLTKVIEAIKVRGIYNSSIGEFTELLADSEDNRLIPSRSGQLAAETGGLDKHLWLMPLDMLVKVARELFAARQEVKGTIYEIIGIADILRGGGDPTETATGAGIKDKWGTLRLKRLQRRVQFFVRDLFRLIAEAAPQAVSLEMWQSATDLELPSRLEVQMARMQLQAIPQDPMAGGQPPDPKLMQLANSPSWEDVLEFLQNQAQRTYSIDVESNSTVDIEATEDKEAIAEFMNAMGQFLAGISPLVESGAMPFEAAKGMLREIMRRFRFSKHIEEYLDQMQPPQQANPEELKAQQKQIQTESEKLKAFEAQIQDALRELEGKQKDFKHMQEMAAQDFQHKSQIAENQAQMRNQKLQMAEKSATMKFEAVVEKLLNALDMQVERKKSELMKAKQPAGAAK